MLLQSHCTTHGCPEQELMLGHLPAWLPHLPSVISTFNSVCNPVPQTALPVSPLQIHWSSGLSREQTSSTAAFLAEGLL